MQGINHFASECPNMPTDEETDCDDADPASLINDDTRLLSLWLRGRNRIFKLVKGKNGATSFLPLKDKTGGRVNYIQNKEAMHLTEKQTDYVYKTVEEGNIINTKTMTHETVQNEDDNSYKKVVLNKAFREEDKCSEMRNWSISVTTSDTSSMIKRHLTN